MTDYQVGDAVKVSFEGVVRHTGPGSTVCVEAPGMAYRSTFVLDRIVAREVEA